VTHRGRSVMVVVNDRGPFVRGRVLDLSRAAAKALLDRARPSTTIVRAHDVEITFDGAVADRERLDAALELASAWANPTDAGPYR
ncbi:MAG: RlpA-like double-psi beta-barrel domain-containing protein, partial [Acidobacteriota bacterium]